MYVHKVVYERFYNRNGLAFPLEALYGCIGMDGFRASWSNGVTA